MENNFKRILEEETTEQLDEGSKEYRITDLIKAINKIKSKEGNIKVMFNSGDMPYPFSGDNIYVEDEMDDDGYETENKILVFGS